MHDFPEAYGTDHLHELVESNDSCPSPSRDEIARIAQLARQRASARPDGLEDDQAECLISTEWASFIDDWGFDNGDQNQFALGVFEGDVSSGKDADLFNDVVVVQNGWLTTGDGRRAQIQPYMDEGYDAADEGEMWIPNGAQDYIAIIALTDDLLEDE